MLHIQKYLQDNKLATLAAKGVNIRRGTKYSNLITFKYDMIEANFSDPMVRECRGLVLDEADDWRVVCRSFDKFFNVGEGHAADIDWNTAVVQEKLDGSLLTMYFYKDEWHVCTTGTPDAGGRLNNTEFNFAQYFWDTFYSSNGTISELTTDHEDLCFSFELMGPHNRVVVVHDQPWLRLISVRNKVTGEFFWPEQFSDLVGIPPVKVFSSYSDLQHLENSFETMSPVSQEGYIVVDGNFNRVKMKHPGYVALHHAKDGMSTKSFVEVVRTGETSELVAVFPEFKNMLDDVKTRYDNLVVVIDKEYKHIKSIPVQKAFAEQAVKTNHSAALFWMRKTNGNVKEYLKDLRLETLMSWLGLKNETSNQVGSV